MSCNELSDTWMLLFRYDVRTEMEIIVIAITQEEKEANDMDDS